jgi:hypothetical protein
MSISPSLLSAMGFESNCPSPLSAGAWDSAVEAAAPESAGISAAELPELSELSEEALELLHAVRLSAIAAASIIERNFFIVCYLSE